MTLILDLSNMNLPEIERLNSHKFYRSNTNDAVSFNSIVENISLRDDLLAAGLGFVVFFSSSKRRIALFSVGQVPAERRVM